MISPASNELIQMFEVFIEFKFIEETHNPTPLISAINLFRSF